MVLVLKVISPDPSVSGVPSTRALSSGYGNKNPSISLMPYITQRNPSSLSDLVLADLTINFIAWTI